MPTVSTPAVEILIIGNEVLAGDVQDTNSYWLCRQLAARGAQVKRIAVLPDDPTAIGEELRSALDRRPELIITCGGLGPTADDLTLAAVGAALDRPVQEDAVAFAMIRDLYARLFSRGHVTTPDMTPARAKMAQLPLGSQPLANAVGAAPGVLLQEGETWLACLPGVPAEMKDIFEHALWPRLAARFGGQVYAERTIQTECWDESILAPAVDGVAARRPEVYVKSRAQVYGSGVADFVTLAARAADEAQVVALLDAAETDLEKALGALGVRVIPGQVPGNK